MEIISILQVIVSIILIALILMQQRGSAMGSMFGQDSGTSYSTKRGLDKKIFTATIVLAIIFGLLAVINLVF